MSGQSGKLYNQWKQAFFVVPKAHKRIFDYQYQEDIYRKFHTKRSTQWLHFACTTTIMVLLFVFSSWIKLDLSFLNINNPVNGMLITLFLLVVYYLFYCPDELINMVPLVICAFGTAFLIVSVADEIIWLTSMAIFFTFLYIQTFSHLLEPVPPPWSGTKEFISLQQFISDRPAKDVILISILSVTFYPLLEVWALPRIWPIQLKMLMEKNA